MLVLVMKVDSGIVYVGFGYEGRQWNCVYWFWL